MAFLGHAGEVWDAAFSPDGRTARLGQLRPHVKTLGHRHRPARADAPRARGAGLQRRVRQGRDAPRLGQRRQDGDHLGRRRAASPIHDPARAHRQCPLRRVQPRRQHGRHGELGRDASDSGTRQTGSRSGRTARPAPAGSRGSPSAPTAAGSPSAARRAGPRSGTIGHRPRSSSGSRATPGRSSASPSAPTAGGSPRAAMPPASASSRSGTSRRGQRDPLVQGRLRADRAGRLQPRRPPAGDLGLGRHRQALGRRHRPRSPRPPRPQRPRLGRQFQPQRRRPRLRQRRRQGPALGSGPPRTDPGWPKLIRSETVQSDRPSKLSTASARSIDEDRAFDRMPELVESAQVGDLVEGRLDVGRVKHAVFDSQRGPLAHSVEETACFTRPTRLRLHPLPCMSRWAIETRGRGYRRSGPSRRAGYSCTGVLGAGSDLGQSVSSGPGNLIRSGDPTQNRKGCHPQADTVRKTCGSKSGLCSADSVTLCVGTG